MKILVRLPNWLGDVVMSVGLINNLHHFYPQAEISVIVKNELKDLIPFFTFVKHTFPFSKKEYRGVTGAWTFGKEIRAQEKFDLFICLPDSFSSAVMGLAIGANKRVGFKKEMRFLFLTHAYKKRRHLHRAQEYTTLLELYTKKRISETNVSLHHSFTKGAYVVVNINSEASSRRLTIAKAKEFIDGLRSRIPERLILVGAPKESAFVEEVMSSLATTENIENKAGKTSLGELVKLLAEAKLLFTTDSGPAHLANALHTHTVVLFGAGNEQNTAPYNKEFVTVIRLNGLSCEPCRKNVCVRYETPQCLERLNAQHIIETTREQLKKNSK